MAIKLSQLASPGSRSIEHLIRLFADVPWWTLVPDVKGDVLVWGAGSGQERAATALTSDRSLAMVYLPGDRDITIDLAHMKGPQVRGRWFDPANGAFEDASQRVFTSLGTEALRPPGLNTPATGIGC